MIRDLIALMSTLQERITEMVDAGFPVGRLAKAAGVTSSAVSQWKSGQTKTMQAESALGLEDSTGYRAEWIVLGRLPKKVEADSVVSQKAPMLPEIVDALAYALEHLDEPQRERAADKLRILGGAPDSASAKRALVAALAGLQRGDSQLGGLGEFGT